MIYTGRDRSRLADEQTRPGNPPVEADGRAKTSLRDAPERVCGVVGWTDVRRHLIPQGRAYRLLTVHACNSGMGRMPFLFDSRYDYSEFAMPERPASQPPFLGGECRARRMTDDACLGRRDHRLGSTSSTSPRKRIRVSLRASKKEPEDHRQRTFPARRKLFPPRTGSSAILVENSLGGLWAAEPPDSRWPDADGTYYIRAPRKMPETIS